MYNFNSVTEYKNGQKEWRQYSTNARNQVTQAGTTMVGWDANGNMITKSNGYTFHYNFQNQLREAVNPGGLTIQYGYDPSGRRIMKKLTNGPLPLTTVYVWDDQEVVEEYTKADTGSLQLSKQYVPAQSIDQKISANADLNGDGVLEAEYFYLQDQLGNVEAIVDNQGNTLEEYDYRGYGNAKIYAPDSTGPQVEQVRTLADGKLSLLFTEPVYADTINADTLKVLDSNSAQVAGSWSLNAGKREATFDGSLTNGAAYTVNVSSIRDLALNQMAPYSKGFTMATGTVLDDTKAPEIERIWQSEGNVFVGFTEDLAAGSVAADAIQITRNALPATGTSTLYDARILKFTPDQSLVEDYSYNLTISASVSDLSGSPLTPNPSPLLFQYTPLPVAFYTRADQRQERNTSAYRNFSLFQGLVRDDETGLLYARARWMDTALGTWTTQDPSKYSDAYNLYQAFGQSPMNFADPHGNKISIAMLTEYEKLQVIKGLQDATKEHINVSKDQMQLLSYDEGTTCTSEVQRFLGEVFNDGLTIHLAPLNHSKIELAKSAGRTRVEIDFYDFYTLSYTGAQVEESFNLGWILIHEFIHSYKMWKDYYTTENPPPIGSNLPIFRERRDFDWFIKDVKGTRRAQVDIYRGPVIDYENRMKEELGLPIRLAYKAYGVPYFNDTENFTISHDESVAEKMMLSVFEIRFDTGKAVYGNVQ